MLKGVRHFSDGFTTTAYVDVDVAAWSMGQK